MLKASMGGGGKGMRLIHSEDEVVEAYNTAGFRCCFWDYIWIGGFYYRLHIALKSQYSHFFVSSV